MKSGANKNRRKDNFAAMNSAKEKSGKSGIRQERAKLKGKKDSPSDKMEDAKRKPGTRGTSKYDKRPEEVNSRGKKDRLTEKREDTNRKPGTRGTGKYVKRPDEVNPRGKQERPSEKREYAKRSPKSRDARNRGKKEQVKTNKPLYNDEGSMRLNRYISNAGVCSRREADEFIIAGLVTINGEVVIKLGTKVGENDVVKFDGRTLSPEKKVYVLLNKPKNFVTTTEDPHADKIVMDLIKHACSERVYPVGRLDRNTTGLLLFTNDGDLSKRLTHPSYNHKKIYHVALDKQVSKQHMLEIANGIQLEDGLISADEIKYISIDDKTEIGIEIHSGRNRIVRRIFEHLGYYVKRLDRVYFAGLTKKNLPRGKWRMLDPKEVIFLKMNK